MSSPDTDDQVSCANCGLRSSGAFCPACGQELHRSRFTLWNVVRHVADDIFNLNHGFLATVVGLSIRPGVVVREYLAGRTVAYANPAKYLVVFAAIAAVISLNLTAMTGYLEDVALAGAESPEMEVAAAVFTDMLTRYFNITLLAAVPFFVVFSRFFFRRTGYNIAEHLIFNMYVYGHQNALFLPFVPFLYFFPESATWLLSMYFVGIVAYYLWAAERFFQVGRMRGILLAATVVTLTYVIYYLALAVTVIVVAVA